MLSAEFNEIYFRTRGICHTASPLLIGIHRALSSLAARGQFNGGYYEFGLYRGFSFWFANNLAHDLGLRLDFHGFDSLRGCLHRRLIFTIIGILAATLAV